MNDRTLRQIANELTLSRDREEKAAISEGGGYYLPFAAYNTPSSITISNWIFAVTMPRYMYFVSWRQAAYIGGAIDASNYWKVRISTFSTLFVEYQPIGGGIWAVNVITAFTVQSYTPGEHFLGVYAEKIGNPPVLALSAPLIYIIGA